MLFFVTSQGKEYKVRVESKQGKYFVSVNDSAEVESDLWMFGNDQSYIADHKVLAVNLVGKLNEYHVSRPQGNMNVKVESEYRRLVGSLKGQQLDSDTNIVAKMPGKITKLMVKQGDFVDAGNSVLVMEAMKMENEVRATLRGEVVKIHVKEGQPVESGAMLVELKPLEE